MQFSTVAANTAPILLINFEPEIKDPPDMRVVSLLLIKVELVTVKLPLDPMNFLPYIVLELLLKVELITVKSP